MVCANLFWSLFHFKQSLVTYVGIKEIEHSLENKRKNFKNAVAHSCLNESEYKGCFLTKDIELLDFETFLLTLCNLIILHCMPTSFRQTFGFC